MFYNSNSDLEKEINITIINKPNEPSINLVAENKLVNLITNDERNISSSY